MLKKYMWVCLLPPLCLGGVPSDGLAKTGMAEQQQVYGSLAQWLEQLPPGQQAEARRILNEVRPRSRELRRRIEEKMEELESFSYAQGVAPDTLPRLGQELQELRDALLRLIEETEERLRREAGVVVELPRSRSHGRTQAMPFIPEDPQPASPEPAAPEAEGRQP